MLNTEKTNIYQGSFKKRKTFAARKEEVDAIRAKFPIKIPVIVERYRREKGLPVLDKTKYLVPHELTLSQFVTIIRNRMLLRSNQSFYLLANDKSFSSMCSTLAEIYHDERDSDGFLYMSYASQEMFGSMDETAIFGGRYAISVL